MRSVCRLSLSIGLVVAWGIHIQASEAQNIRSPATAIHNWRNTAPGLSSNARLALYRNQNIAYSGRYRAYGGRTLYRAPYYAITTHRSVPRAFVSSSTYNRSVPVNTAGQTAKPFNNLRRPRNAVERYWPLLAEGREDPRTGLVIWQLP